MSSLQEVQQLKELSNEKFAVLAEEQKFYETQCENNEEMNRQLDELNSKAVLQRRLNLELTEDTNHLKSEVMYCISYKQKKYKYKN